MEFKIYFSHEMLDETTKQVHKELKLSQAKVDKNQIGEKLIEIVFC